MDAGALERAHKRVAEASEGRPDAAVLEAALERARSQIEALTQAAAELEASLPERVGDAVRAALDTQVAPVARHLAELRGLAGQTIRRLERLEGDLLGERHARVDDLAILVDLIASGWKSVDQRLERLEEGLRSTGIATVYRIADVPQDVPAATPARGNSAPAGDGQAHGNGP